MKRLITAAAFAASLATPALADWQATLDGARGQTVYWNAWGGDARTNDFITWASTQLDAAYGVKIEQVKLTDTAEAVSRVVSEKAAGQDTGGSVDMIWINGPNFLAMKKQGLLHGPFVADLPNAKYLDLSPASPNSVDFTTPVEGLESPWRLAKFVFTYDSARVADRMLARAKESFGLASAEVDRIASAVAAEVVETQRHFDSAMLLILVSFCATLATVMVVGGISGKSDAAALLSLSRSASRASSMEISRCLREA
jgi:hypothetical protein